MRRSWVLALIVLGFATALTGTAQNTPASRKARVYRAEFGHTLPSTARATKPERVAGFLRGKGVANGSVNSMRFVSESRGRNGVTHLRGEQEVAGLRVHNAEIRAAFNADGELIHLIDDLAPVSGNVTRARSNESRALEAALAALYPGLNLAIPQRGRSGNVATFNKNSFFHDEPRVERVAISMSDGTLEEGFLVETWTERNNQLHETLVNGDGRVLEVESRTNKDSYNVFTENPNTAQQVKVGPGGPRPWLFPGDHSSLNIAGNNVRAYLDVNADNTPDAGGATVSNGDFLTTFILGISPSLDPNRAVAVQNLFYLNNVIHDDLYSHGFTEAAGNFQENNFGLGKGRTGSDSVLAEAQDGEGTDNANFATPRDGRPPRMQMFLFNGIGDHEVVVHTPISTTLRAQRAAFGGVLDLVGVPRDVVLVADGTAPTGDLCEPIAAGSLTGTIALIDRGLCDFTVKVKNAQNAGAAAAIVANNVGADGVFAMGGEDATITISAVMVSKNDGDLLKANLTSLNATVRLAAVQPLQRDASLDSDIVFHEYGHGLTWRMIGRMSGTMAGAIGEGMSDVLAVLYNEDDRIGEYVASDPLGLRSAPYNCFPRTFISVQGTDVHYDGEVYAAIGWHLLQTFELDGVGKSVLLDYLVDGMNYTPAAPTFEEMRDGILDSINFTGGGSRAHRCLVWRAFAKYGVGAGAQSRRGVALVESKAIPLVEETLCSLGPSCPPLP